MLRIFSFFKKSLFQASPPQLDPDELRRVFAGRYAQFRRLLTANNNALQAMAELEKIYYSGESYRMAVVRSKITAILVNVYKMTQSLLQMSDGRYLDLERKFEKISGDINTILERKPTYQQGPFVVPLVEVSRKTRELAGDKMAGLGEIHGLEGVVVPQGFVITSSATRHFLPDHLIAEINRHLQVVDPDDIDDLYRTCAELEKMVMECPLPADLEELIYMHYSHLESSGHSGCRVALRSSALGEDTAGTSFAGLYRTVLHVEKSMIINAYRAVVASKYGAKAISYRRERGFRHEDIEMCVGCLVMVDALVSGVAYSRDPGEKESDVVRINATSGIAQGVVDGTKITDLYLVGRERPHPVVYSEIRQGARNTADTLPSVQSLTYAQIKKLAETAVRLENHFGTPQDIEWAFDHMGVLYILQSRAIMMLKKAEAENIDAVSRHDEKGESPVLFGGICAGAGIACGAVFRVGNFEDIRSFPKGAVLVVEYPLPDYAPLLSKAAAVISEHGSEAGHLATVSREFGIPALFSLPRAMTALDNEQIITVNSSNRAVYRGCREDLLSRKSVKRDIMAGSPVQRILTEALQYITPLNLNDPSSLQFKSSWCETLHDITRFCHEKSVSAMFDFGERFHFDKVAAKRLVGDVPLEWWVINLADGFRKGFDENLKIVRIEDIVSLPMQAIWQGISAFPWLGPPPLSAKGFGSIIFQSTMRPELDPAVASSLTAKNYFLISQNFCNLSVRLGYHYAMIESYISDLLTESYVTFRFKGGAADMKRKAVRARLLSEILLRYGFSVELRSDALLARLKKKPIEYLQKRLQVLGYLTLHTRQLDMVMSQPRAVEQYREKFLQEIDEMLGGKGISASGGADHGDIAKNPAG